MIAATVTPLGLLNDPSTRICLEWGRRVDCFDAADFERDTVFVVRADFNLGMMIYLGVCVTARQCAAPPKPRRCRLAMAGVTNKPKRPMSFSPTHTLQTPSKSSPMTLF